VTRRSVSFAEFERRRQARPKVQRFVRCSACGVKMPVPRCPGAEPSSGSVCQFDTCDSCREEYRATLKAGDSADRDAAPSGVALTAWLVRGKPTRCSSPTQTSLARSANPRTPSQTLTNLNLAVLPALVSR
jgi:hypothetical protein